MPATDAPSPDLPAERHRFPQRRASLLAAVAVAVAAMAGVSPAQAGKPLIQIDAERLEIARVDRGALEAVERPKRRQRFVALTTLGGVVRPLIAKRGLGCTTSAALGRYLDFYFDGIGTLPGPEECKPIEVGITVKVLECDPKFIVCRFSAGLFSPEEFWTPIHSVDPR